MGILISPFPSYSREMYRAIVAYARKTGRWNLRPMADLSSGTWSRQSAKRLDGIIGYFNRTDRAAARSRELGIPVVNVSSEDGNVRVPSIWPDNRAIGHIAALTLSGLGLRHFVYFGCPGAHFCREREHAFTKALAERGMGCTSFRRPSRGMTGRAGSSSIRKWLRSLPRPCGMFVVSDNTAAKVIPEIVATGFRVPEDFAVVSVGDEDAICPFTHPPLSSIPLPGFAIGTAAARLLDRLMKGDRGPKKPILIPVQDATLRASTSVVACADPLVAEALRLIRKEAPRRMVSGQELALRLGCRRRTLDRRVVAILHKTPKEIIDEARIDFMKRTLRETDDLLKQIRIAMKFSSQSQMTRFFLRMTGMTPSAYRAMR